MFNRVFYSPARSPCSRAALRMIAVALCASGCGWRSAATPKGPSSAVRAAVLRAFVTEVFAPPCFCRQAVKAGTSPRGGIVRHTFSPAACLPMTAVTGCTAGRLRRPLHVDTAKNYVTFYTKDPPSTINLHVNCIYPYKSQTARTSNK